MSSYFIEFITDQNSAVCKDFLIKHEKTCIALMSRFIQNGCFCSPQSGECLAVYFRGDGIDSVKKELCAVILIDNLIFHCIDTQILAKNTSEQGDSFCNVLMPYIKKKPFGILGDVFGTELLQKIIKHTPLIEWDYLLFEYSASNNTDFSVPTECMLRQCNAADYRALFPLQKQYEIEEVLPPGSFHNALVSISNLQKALQEQLIFALFNADDKALAKAGTNARGLNWDQLGGVFTESEYRGRGYARILTHHLAELLTDKQRQVALFVKKSNTQAQRAYIHAGFTEVCPYKIVYY